MLFNSVGFAVFCPVTVMVYLMLDSKIHRHKAANLWLLVTSYFYYMCADVRFGALLFFVTCLTFLAGRYAGTGSLSRGVRKTALCTGVASCVLILVFFKYFNLAADLMNADSAFRVVLPVGISFYIFQSLTYVIDAYKEIQKPEKDFLKYALFVSFFPVLLAGPIERSINLLPQFDERHSFNYERVRHGLLKMGAGYFMKIVVASRLAIAVDLIYDNYADVNGFQLLLATVLYAFQIYCDFASYSSIALGVGELMGFKLTENFRQPFFASSCAELWRRWHISLNDWFRNYVYFPLGGSRKGRARKYLNIMTVFTLSGMWHGASLHYILWGMLSGAFQVMGDILKPAREAVAAVFPVKNDTTARLHKVLQILCTFVLFVVSLVFFRAGSAKEALFIFQRIVSENPVAGMLSTSVFKLGLGVYNLAFLIAALIFLAIFDVINEKSGDACKEIVKKPAVIRWTVYYVVVIMIIMSASIGAKKFIYFEF